MTVRNTPIYNTQPTRAQVLANPNAYRSAGSDVAYMTNPSGEISVVGDSGTGAAPVSMSFNPAIIQAARGGSMPSQLISPRTPLPPTQVGVSSGSLPDTGAPQTGGNSAIAAALAANPQLLQQYWQNNPQALQQAARDNPDAFAAGAMDQAGGYTTGQTMANGLPQTGLIGSEQALRGGLEGGLAAMLEGVNQSTNTLSPYMQMGSNAADVMANLSGVNGPAAQQAGYANFMASPGQQYLRDQGEQAILRNAAATGGLGGGNVQQELQRHAIGLAAQDFNNSYNRMGALLNNGQNAAQLLSGIQNQGGLTGSNMAYGTGQLMAQGRTRAGEQIANAVAGTTSGLSNLINQQGGALSNVVGTGSTNIANLLAGSGRDQAQALQDLARLLANVSVGQGTQASAQSNIGQLTAATNDNTQKSWGNALTALGGVIDVFNSEK